LEENQKLILSIAVVALVLVAIGSGLYLDWKKLSAARAELDEKEQESVQLDQQIDIEIPALKERKRQLGERVADYEKILPSAKEIEAMDETLNSYGGQARIKVLERRPVRETRRPTVPGQVPLYEKYSYRLSMVADFFSWVEFVRLLENHERFIRVDELDVRVDDEETGALAITMKVSTFSYAKVEQPTSVTPAPTAAAPVAGVQ